MRLQAFVLFSAALLSIIAVNGCVSLSSVAPPVTPALLNAAGGTSAITLNEGRRIFTQPCATCHAPDPIGKYSLQEWRAAVDDMAPRAKLDLRGRAALLAYLSAAKSAAAISPPR